jgi:maleylpyruvate isomerase
VGPPSEVRRLHPEGYDADAAAGASALLSGDKLERELRRSLVAVEAAWDALDDTLWDCEAIMMAGRRTMIEVVAHHLRNVEVHHVDLDIGYQPSDWPPAFVAGELARRLRGLRDRAEPAELLAWLLDRGPSPHLTAW